MADRFPSIEDIDNGQPAVPSAPHIEGIEISEPSDFLARERAALGDDADQFSTPVDNVARNTQNNLVDDDLLSGGDNIQQEQHQQQQHDDMGAFENNFPVINTHNQGVGPNGTVTDSNTTLPHHSNNPTSSQFNQSEEDSEPVRQWRERRDLAIQHRDKVSSEKKAETVKAARSAIDEFYENYNNKKEKTINQTKKEAEEFLKNREDTTSGGTSWERVAKLVDLSGKGQGAGEKAKFRELLLSLRKDEKAPGATGV